MVKKRFFLILMAFLFFLPVLSSHESGKHKHFHVLASEFEPFAFKDGDKMTGLDIDILDIILKSEGCTYEVETVPFSAVFDKLETGDYDIAVGGLYHTSEREKKFIPSMPYFESGLVIVSPTSHPVNFEKELRDKTVGVKKGTYAQKYLEKLNTRGFNISVAVFETTDEVFEALKSGKTDALFNDYVGSLHLIIVKYAGEMIISEDYWGINLIDKNNIVFYFNPALKEEALEFDKNMRNLERADILEQLRNKWTPGIQVKKTGLIVKFVYILLGLVLFIGFFAFVQRENLKRRTLKLSEARYRNMLEHSPFAVILHREGKLLFANKTVYRIFGLKEGGLKEGFPVIRLFAEGEHARLMNFLDRRAEGKDAPESYETYGLRSDGTAFPVDVNVATVNSGEGKVTLLAMKDISEQKKISTELQKSEERYRHIFEEIDHGIFVSTKAGKPLVANPALVKMLGYESFEDILKRDIEKEGYADPKERKRFQEIMERAGRVTNFETIWLKKDGTPINVVESSNPVTDESGNIMAYEGIVKDITEKKKAEEALRQSESYYRNLFELAHDEIMVFDPEGEIILDANEQCLKLYGLKREEFVGRSLERLSKNVAKGKDRIDEVLKKGQLRNFETVHFNKDGSERILEINASVIDFKGRAAILSHGRDITEKKKAEKLLMDRNRQLVALVKSAEAMGSFADLRSSGSALCNAAVESFSLKMAWLGLVVPESTEVKVVASAGADDGYTSKVNVRWDESVHARGPTGRSIVTRSPVVMKVTDPDFAPWREEAEKRGVKVSCSFPLIHEDAVRGALNLYSENEDAFSQEKVETLEIFARHATMAIVTASLYEEANKTIEELLIMTGEKDKISKALEARAGELEKSEIKFRNIVEQARAILLVFDQNGIVTYWNEFAAAFFGFREDEMLGKSLFETIVPPMESTGRDLKELLLSIIKETNKFASNINENITKDGKRVWIAWTNRPILDEKGDIVEVLSVGTDISNLKMYETAILKWENLFSEILRDGNGFIYRRNVDLKLTESGIHPDWDEELKKKWIHVQKELDKEPGRSEFFTGVIKPSHPGFRRVSVEFDSGEVWTVVDSAQAIQDSTGTTTYITGFCLRVS